MASKWGKAGTGALSGAGSGAAIGSVIPGIGTAVGAGVGALIGGIGGLFGGNDDDELKQYMADLEAQRAQTKLRQEGLVRTMQAPVISAAYQNRIKALEDQSKPTTLAEDPYFQGQRAMAVQGGQQALSGVQNQNRGQNVTGGFTNIGSTNDVYDRLSAQLSGLAQNSAQLKDQKAQQAADMQQARQDAQTNFENARQQALLAIEAGDSAAATQAIQAAYEAKAKIAEADQQMLTGALESAGQFANAFGASSKLSNLNDAAALKKRVAAESVSPTGQTSGSLNTNVSGVGNSARSSTPTAGNINSLLNSMKQIQKPYAAMRR